jgi:methylthioribose-1-phosphate isomerase
MYQDDGRGSSNELVTVAWRHNSVLMIDQTKLPNRLAYVTCKTYQQVAYAIKTLAVRGAPAIGVAAAMGLALACTNSRARGTDRLLSQLAIAYELLRSTRPTAVNLSWALHRVMKKAREGNSVAEIKKLVVREAVKIAEQDIEINKQIGKTGARFFEDGDIIMTHCNAGSLATAGYGTALGVVRAVKESGKNVKVVATETRPVLQGSRLTAFELKHDGIDVSLIPDSAVGFMMAKGIIKSVIVGADRVLHTGHVFNKIGTYQIATLAKAHKIPFYVAAPISTFDLKSEPDEVIIEDRSQDEIVIIGNRRIAPKDIHVFNPAFDITPPNLITAIITERLLLVKPLRSNIQRLFSKH